MAPALAEEVIADASCFKTGTAIKDSLVPAPIAWTATASECQTKCKESPDCGHFSWKEDTLPKGGCWLLPEATTEEADEKAVSGPKDCPEFEALGGAGGAHTLICHPLDASQVQLELAAAWTPTCWWPFSAVPQRRLPWVVWPPMRPGRL